MIYFYILFLRVSLAYQDFLVRKAVRDLREKMASLVWMASLDHRCVYFLIKLLGENVLNSHSDVQYFRLISMFCIFLQGPRGDKGDRGDRVSLLLA